jgi:hypothetical protein
MSGPYEQQQDGDRRRDGEALPRALRDAVALLRAAPEAAPDAVARATAAALAAQQAARAGRVAVGRLGRPAWPGWRAAAWAAGVVAAAGLGARAWSARGDEGPVPARVADGGPSTVAGRLRASPVVPAPDAGATAPAALRALDEAPRLVRFRLRAPGARSVTVVGDFNRWDRAATPLGAPDARAGEWTADVPLTPGRHAYAFVVDERRWMLDPAAPSERDADFGRAHSVTVVGLEAVP